MVKVTLSETYDLSTKVGKMSLIGIHTPKREIIEKTYPGLCMNARYVRVVSQNVTISCASMLPADPLQIGTEIGKIAPQDMFNPILYKACSNDSFSTVEARLHGLRQYPGDQVVIEGQSAIKSDDFTSEANDEAIYYALLSNRDGFRVAHPQQGLTMNGLVPLVFERYYNSGENGLNVSAGSELQEPIITKTSEESRLVTATKYVQSMRGRPHPMPKFNTTYVTSARSGDGGLAKANPMGDTNGPGNYQAHVPEILPVYTACIIMPPCKLNRLWYRMHVSTVLEFSDIRPIQEITSFNDLGNTYAPFVYATDYANQSKMMSQSLGLVDVKDAELEKIMEGR